jgi:hypothetical protein
MERNRKRVDLLAIADDGPYSHRMPTSSRGATLLLDSEQRMSRNAHETIQHCAVTPLVKGISAGSTDG